MLSEGKGEQPKPEDVVTVKYRGTLSDGREFENTGDTPARFALMTVIPGLEQGIRQLREGGKAKILIPPTSPTARTVPESFRPRQR